MYCITPFSAIIFYLKSTIAYALQRKPERPTKLGYTENAEPQSTVRPAGRERFCLYAARDHLDRCSKESTFQHPPLIFGIESWLSPVTLGLKKTTNRPTRYPHEELCLRSSWTTASTSTHSLFHSLRIRLVLARSSQSLHVDVAWIIGGSGQIAR